ncbi:MAG: hypothetical protein NTY53_26465 [Kiritimatiellaeota bacterium]|nr:hypothetical protein [Kiritimatiellota bacterium]
MKRIIIATLMAVQLFVGTSSALADVITVNFASVVTPTDITAPNSLTLSNVTFSFDNFGINPDSTFGNPNNATVDEGGITGNTGGALKFDFEQTAYSLVMDFSVLSSAALPLPVVDGMNITFDNLDNLTVPSTFYNVDGNAAGHLEYASATGFTHAEVYFSADAPYFNVSSMAYAIPEPSLLVPMLVGIVVLARRRILRG